MTEHRTSGHSTYMKQNLQTYVQHRNWVRLARPAGLSCIVCLVAACRLVLKWYGQMKHSHHLLWHAIALIHLATGAERLVHVMH